MKKKICKAVQLGKAKRKGFVSDEWVKDGKPQYYCYGYIDNMTDELIPECASCPYHVKKAQADFEEWKKNEVII